MVNPLIAQLLLAGLVIQVVLGLVAYAILLERKVAAWIQDRVGPNRAGPQGLLQPIADGVKFILKEEFIPANANKVLFILAPIVIMTCALVGFSVIPWAGVLDAGTKLPAWLPLVGGIEFKASWPVMIANPDVGVLIVLAAASMAVYGVVLAGYSSGSKYSFLGGLRATSQMISYEIPMMLSIMAVAVMAGTLNLHTLGSGQVGYYDGWMAWLPKWNLFTQPLAFALFTVCIFAESNRTPFDLPECETELVGGYHTEYSSMKFALFFLAEYCSMIVGAAVVVTLFLGGWHLPWVDHLIYGGTQPVNGGWVDAFIKFGVFWGKIVAFLFLYMWVRWTLPRFRFDQLMNLAWRGLIPLSVGTFLIPTTVIMLQREGVITAPALWLFVGNVVLLVGTLVILAVLPKSNPNPRASLARSRYNPQLVRPVTE